MLLEGGHCLMAGPDGEVSLLKGGQGTTCLDVRVILWKQEPEAKVG